MGFMSHALMGRWFGIWVGLVFFVLGLGLTPPALGQSPDYAKELERRVCVHDAGVPKNWSKWAIYPNGVLATYSEEEFYSYLPPGAEIHVYDPNAPGCKNGKPIPAPSPPPTTKAITTKPAEPPSANGQGVNAEAEGRKNAEAEARKKAEIAAANAAEQAREEGQILKC